MSTQRGTKPLLLDLLGFEDRSRSAFEMAIGNRAKGRCVLAHASVANAVLIDIDRASTPAAWDKYRDRYPGRLAIFTSLYDGKQPEGAFFLKKPIKIEQFIELLDLIAKQPLQAAARGEAAPHLGRNDTASTRRGTTARTIRTARQGPKRTQTVKLSSAAGGLVTKVAAHAARPLEGAAHRAPSADLPGQEPKQAKPPPPAEGEKLIETFVDVDCALPAQVAERTYSGRAVLLSMLRNACAMVESTKKAHRVKIGTSDWITIAADGRLVWTSLEEERFDSLFIETGDTPLALAVCLPGEEKMAEGAAKWCTDAEAILWRAGSATYRGKLPPGTDPKVRVFLSRWPNLTRVLELPNAVRIAALWSEQRLSLAFTAEILKIPQRYVFAFYGAAYSAGLAGPVQRSEDVVIAEARVEPNSRRGLFSKILDRLLGLGA